MRIIGLFFTIFTSCQYYNGKIPVTKEQEDKQLVVDSTFLLSSHEIRPAIDTPIVQTGQTSPAQLIAYAKTLIGTPYRYGSVNPTNGFDCSGFITYVFNHFNISVPRSSIGFTNLGTKIELSNAKAGDLILFTGTDNTVREVGHMGIIHSVNGNEIDFIHSTSGRANGVTITPLNKYYLGRFVKVIRIF